jgi:hypothetical protein
MSAHREQRGLGEVPQRPQGPDLERIRVVRPGRGRGVPAAEDSAALRTERGQGADRGASGSADVSAAARPGDVSPGCGARGGLSALGHFAARGGLSGLSSSRAEFAARGGARQDAEGRGAARAMLGGLAGLAGKVGLGVGSGTAVPGEPGVMDVLGDTLGGLGGLAAEGVPGGLSAVGGGSSGAGSGAGLGAGVPGAVSGSDSETPGAGGPFRREAPDGADAAGGARNGGESPGFGGRGGRGRSGEHSTRSGGIGPLGGLNGSGRHGSSGSRRSQGLGGFGGPGSVPPAPPGVPGDGDPNDPGHGPAAERELRLLLQQAVGGLEPAPGSLERLRAAVPRRRTRRRQAVGGSLVLLVLLGVAVPMLESANGSSLRVAEDGASRSLQSAGASQQGPPGSTQSGAHLLPYGPSGPSGSPTASLLPGGSGVIQSWGFTLGAGAWPTSRGSGSATAGGGAARLPECTRAQLGAGRAALGQPSGDGTVYGVFWVANVSNSSCVVSTPGTVAVTGAQGTSSSRISVVMHSSGDPATALPSPQSAPAAVALAPSGAYQIDFAWVPDSSNGSACGTGSTGATPTSGASSATSGGTSSGSTDSGSSGVSASATPASGGGSGSGSSSITLGHTPGAGGSAAATVQIAGACSGTVYRTEPLPVTKNGTQSSGSATPTGAAGSGSAAQTGGSGGGSGGAGGTSG